MPDAPSKLLVQQRVRNRILEYLEAVTEYPRNCGVWDLNELINEWQSWVAHPFSPRHYPPPAFSVDEVSALAITHDAWNAFADATPQDIRDEPAALSAPEWEAFVDACTWSPGVGSASERVVPHCGEDRSSLRAQGLLDY